ncbi:uncharacterized protein LOC123536202 [Mercenaria mercenaria]|uniref:uncharacterized protein LOC123536202 n=1 Tax=Mercenaria mercenaria TaxID=6596 RepID=UPI00234EDC48|nr:uncharacterized protein LOC123536202 [Mercenaria mercenaria]
MARKVCNAGNIVHYLSSRSVQTSFRQEDQVLRHRYSVSETLHWKNLVGHYGCVNAIEFSHGQGTLVASGGDDRRVFLWDVEKALSDIGKPSVMRGEHNSNIFCVAFDIGNTTAFSGGNDEQVIVHDLTTGETKDVFSHDDAVYGLSPDPTNPYMFATSCDDGRILIFDTRDSCADPFCLANYTSSMHSVMYNPVEPRLLATANAKEGVGLWDVRKPRSCLLRYGGSLVQQSCMSVKFNQRGDHIIALRRRLPPVLYNIASHEPVCEFDHRGYYNSCTMKSICFAGDNDQYVLSGSDEFNLYMWALPDDLSERSYINSAHMVLKGHRSIVNQVRFNPANHLIISSGVEKIIKVWSPFKFPEKERKEGSFQERRVYTHEEYINLVLQNGNVMSHDYSQESTEEDPRMMAFFDSLVQRELDGWSSDDSMSSNEEALYSRIIQLSQSDIDSDDSFPDLGQNEHDDPAYSPFSVAFASVMASQAAEGNDAFPRLNHALENAERVYAETSDGPEVASGSDGIQVRNVHPENVSQRSMSEDIEESSSHIGLTTLIKRKKEQLKESMKRRAKYPFAEIFASDSDENVDDSESDDSSVSSLNIVIGGSNKSCVREVKNLEDSKASDSSKHSQDKLLRLKNLRKSVMNSDSCGNYLEIHEKKLNSETLEASSSNFIFETGEQFEKVHFKKFTRRNKMKTEMLETDSKEELKSRASPDLGPFLQKAGTTSASVGVRKDSFEEGNSANKGKLSSDSFSYKGKHKSKSSHRRGYMKKSEKQHLHTSEFKNKCVSKERKTVKSDSKVYFNRLLHGEKKYEDSGKTDKHVGNICHKKPSHRQVIEDRKHHHNGHGEGKCAIKSEDEKYSQRLKNDGRNYSHIDIGSGKSQHRSRVKSASDATLDIDERRYEFYSEERERYEICVRENKNKSVMKKECENSRKIRSDQASNEKRHQCSYSEDDYLCKGHGDGVFDDKKVGSARFDDTQAHTVTYGKSSSVMGGASGKDDADGSSDSKDICFSTEEVVHRQLDNGSGISDSETEFVEENENQKKMNSFSRVAGNDGEEPSCSYKLEICNKVKCKLSESTTHQSENESVKSEKSDSSEDGQATCDESHVGRSSSSNDEDQLTWVEFRNFKNRLERAHKRYKKEYHNRRNKRSLSDEK